jgi:hypothetical protein
VELPDPEALELLEDLMEIFSMNRGEPPVVLEVAAGAGVTVAFLPVLQPVATNSIKPINQQYFNIL